MSKPSTPAKGLASNRSKSAPISARKPSRPLPAASSSMRGRRYVKQPATFEGRKDKRPIIFNYGRNLPSAMKTRIQKRMYLTFAGIIIAAIIGVVVFGWINFTIIQPGQPIVTVNGKPVPQRMYRYMVAYLAQDSYNQLQNDTKQVADLNAQIAKDPSQKDKLTPQITTLQTVISSLQTAFTQTQVDQLAIDNLTEDQLIQVGATNFVKADPKLKGTFDVSTKELNDAFAAFKKAFPAGNTYSNFISKNGMSDDNVKSALLVKLRRSKMDTYLQSLVTSPTLQIDAQQMLFDNQQNAKNDLAKMTSGKAKWEDLVKSDSIDTNTRTKLGDLGWFANGQQDQELEKYAFDPQRKVGDMSGVIKEVGGQFVLLRIVGIDKARVLDSGTVSSLKSNALSHYLTGARNDANIPPYNQDMFNSANNVPQSPIFPVQSAAPTPSPFGQ